MERSNFINSISPIACPSRMTSHDDDQRRIGCASRSRIFCSRHVAVEDISRPSSHNSNIALTELYRIFPLGSSTLESSVFKNSLKRFSVWTCATSFHCRAHEDNDCCWPMWMESVSCPPLIHRIPPAITVICVNTFRARQLLLNWFVEVLSSAIRFRWLTCENACFPRGLIECSILVSPFMIRRRKDWVGESWRWNSDRGVDVDRSLDQFSQVTARESPNLAHPPSNIDSCPLDEFCLDIIGGDLAPRNLNRSSCMFSQSMWWIYANASRSASRSDASLVKDWSR